MADPKKKIPRSEAQLKAERKYDEKRQTVSVNVRFSPAQIRKLDKLRGDMTRTSFVTKAALEALLAGRA